MSTIGKHCADCERQLGLSYERVHRWLDEFASADVNIHRRERHHAEAVEEVREMWGDRAAMAAKIHIEADCGGRVPSRQEAEKWSLLGPDGIPEGGATFVTDEKE